MRRGKVKVCWRVEVTFSSFLFVGAKKLSKNCVRLCYFPHGNSLLEAIIHTRLKNFETLFQSPRGRRWPNYDLLTTLWNTFLILSQEFAQSYLQITLLLYSSWRSESRCSLNWPNSIWSRNATMNRRYLFSRMLTPLFASSIRSYSKSLEIERVLNVNIPEIVYSRKARV